MTQLAKPSTFSENAKTISASMAQRLKPLGFKKRRNGFNRRLDNGLIHQLSIFSVGAYSIDHGKFYVHVGCYVPEAELYRRNVTEPNWVTDALCTIRGTFPQDYLSLRKVAENLDMLTPYIDNALKALASFNDYADIMGRPSVADQLPSKKSLWFETPQPLVKTCIQIAREDAEGAARTIQHYLAAQKVAENPHLGHIKVVSKWAEGMGLLRSTGT
ncbi:DUF4304 domain-containing protein [uncultured Roseobacter sp.]|uniref:DUF4304 domain-containing protein n=1 Tax=uncultured Roseobacter sp. TaxID=114847 RepID=UPI00262A1227|nr:DUF4304 domain-containing protein [uncultured Roseobacter sp.]